MGADFFLQPVLTVARQLLGMRLVRLLNGERLGGIIVETEAYRGEEDLACHARAGLTPRTQVMYGPPGHAYVYFTYGMHWMLNFVCGEPGYPAAVLLRGIYPTEGLETIAARRPGRHRSSWASGPARLCKALAIDGSFNGHALYNPQSELWIESAPPLGDECVQIGPRIGIPNVPEPWRSKPWRFCTSPTAATQE